MERFVIGGERWLCKRSRYGGLKIAASAYSPRTRADQHSCGIGRCRGDDPAFRRPGSACWPRRSSGNSDRQELQSSSTHAIRSGAPRDFVSTSLARGGRCHPVTKMCVAFARSERPKGGPRKSAVKTCTFLYVAIWSRPNNPAAAEIEPRVKYSHPLPIKFVPQDVMLANEIRATAAIPAATHQQVAFLRFDRFH